MLPWAKTPLPKKLDILDMYHIDYIYILDVHKNKKKYGLSIVNSAYLESPKISRFFFCVA
jgi:hypothetical protein